MQMTQQNASNRKLDVFFKSRGRFEKLVCIKISYLGNIIHLTHLITLPKLGKDNCTCQKVIPKQRYIDTLRQRFMN